MSPPADRDCSVGEGAVVLRSFVNEVVGRPAVLVGNSMGCVVSVLAGAADPGAVRAIALIDAALPMLAEPPDIRVAMAFMLLMTPYAAEVALRAVLRWENPRRSAERVVRTCLADPARLPAEVLEASIALTAHRRAVPSLEHAFAGAARSLVRMLAEPNAYRVAMDSIDVPTLVIHGEADRLVPVRAARRIAASHPDWSTVFLPGVGHVPQLESPAHVVRALSGWLTDMT